MPDCPHCGWSNIRRSMQSTVWDRVARLFFLVPVRCRSCRHRFYVASWNAPEPAPARTSQPAESEDASPPSSASEGVKESQA